MVNLLLTANLFFMRKVIASVLIMIFTFTASELSAQEVENISDDENRQLINLKIELLETRMSILEKRLEKILESQLKERYKEEFDYLDDRIHQLYDSIQSIRVIIQDQGSISRSGVKYSRDLELPEYRNIFAIHPISLFTGSFEFSYEHVIAPAWSLEIGAMGTYVTKQGIGGNYLRSHEFDIISPYSGLKETMEGEMFKGYGASLKLKHFLLHRIDTIERAPIGLYAAPMISFRNVGIQGIINHWNGIKYEKAEVVRHVDIGSVGLILGYQLMAFDVLSIDVFVGGIMRISKYASENEITRYRHWRNIDYSGVLPVAGLKVGVLR